MNHDQKAAKHTEAYSQWMGEMDAAAAEVARVTKRGEQLDIERESDGITIDEVTGAYRA